MNISAEKLKNSEEILSIKKTKTIVQTNKNQNSSNEETKEKLNKLEMKYDELLKENNNLENIIEFLKNEIIDLKKDLPKWDPIPKIELPKIVLDDLDNLEKLNVKLEELETQNGAEINKIESLNLELDSSQKIIKDLMIKLNELESIPMKDHLKIIGELNNEKRTIELEKQEKEDELKKSKQLNSELQNLIDDFNNSVKKTYESELKEQKNLLKNANSKSDDLECENQNLKQKIKMLENEIQTYINKIESLNRFIFDQDQKISSLILNGKSVDGTEMFSNTTINETNLLHRTTNKDSLGFTTVTIEEQIILNNPTLKKLESKPTKKTENSVLQKLENNIFTFVRPPKNPKTRSEQPIMQEMIIDADNIDFASSAELVNSKSEIENLINKNLNLEQELMNKSSQFEEQINDLKKAIREINTEKTTQLNEFKTKLHENQLQLENEKLASQKLKAKLNSIQNEFDEYKKTSVNSFNNASSELAKTKKENGEIFNKIKMLENEIKNLQTNIKTSENNNQKLVNELNNKNQQINSLNLEIKTVKTQIENLTKKTKNTTVYENSVEIQIDENSPMLKNIKEEIDNLKNEIQSLKFDNDRLKRQCEISETDLHEKIKKNDGLNMTKLNNLNIIMKMFRLKLME